MNENCKNFLKSVYGKSDFQYVFSQIPEQKDKEFSILEYLEEKSNIMSKRCSAFYGWGWKCGKSEI